MAKQYVSGAFNEEDLPFARSRREYRDFQRFDKAMKDAQAAEKEQLTKNINLAAQIAAGLSSSDAVKHVVNRLCMVSKDSHTQKETAVYAADSIMRHVSVSDEALLARYERQLGMHLRNIFKRALRLDKTRVPLAAKFLNKILPKWKEKGWFARDLDSIIDAVQKSAPGVSKPDALAKPHGKGGAQDAEEPILPLAETMDMGGEAEPVGSSAPGLGFGATAKAGSPATPMQPDFLAAPRTPRGFRIPSTPRPGQLGVSQAVLGIIPGTPRPPEMNAIPRTPRPDGFAAPFTPAGPVPSTPGAFAAPFTPRPPSATPATPGAPAPFTPAGAAPFTPRGPAPATPGGLVQPFTPRGPAPATPGGLAQPFTPRGPAPGTPAIGGAVQPFTPRGPAPATPGFVQPFTPRGPAPATPGGAAQPFTPAIAQPFTPAIAQPFTPGAQPFTPAVQPFTPGFAPGTPGLGAPGTPGFVPFQGGEAAPVTPAPGGFRPSSGAPGTPGAVPSTPGFMPFRGGEAAPVTPAFRGVHLMASPTHQQSPQHISPQERVMDPQAAPTPSGASEAATTLVEEATRSSEAQADGEKRPEESKAAAAGQEAGEAGSAQHSEAAASAPPETKPGGAANGAPPEDPAEEPDPAGPPGTAGAGAGPAPVVAEPPAEAVSAPKRSAAEAADTDNPGDLEAGSPAKRPRASLPEELGDKDAVPAAEGAEEPAEPRDAGA